MSIFRLNLTQFDLLSVLIMSGTEYNSINVSHCSFLRIRPADGSVNDTGHRTKDRHLETRVSWNTTLTGSVSLFHAIMFLDARFGVLDITACKPMDFQIISLLSN
jgi:hypothetical protein